MNAQSPQDQDRIPVVRERQNGNNDLFEILKSSEKQIHCSPDVMTFPELKVKRPLFARPVTSHSTRYQLTISSFPGSQNWIPACCQYIFPHIFPDSDSDLEESLVL